MKRTFSHMVSLVFGFWFWFGCLTGLRGEILLEEYFGYPDGRLVDMSGGIWKNHSGTESLFVANGGALVGQSDALGGREDVHHLLASEIDPYTDQSTRLYAGFTVTFTSLPPVNGTYTAGSYFAHFKAKLANEFYARVGANTEGAAPGFFRLAIANKSWSSATTSEFPEDLHLGVTYTVVVRLDLATDQSTLWVNPTDEGSPSVTATDILRYGAGPINSFALRQGADGTPSDNGAPGNSLFDNLVVATSFSEILVVPEPTVLSLLGTGVAALLWPRRRPTRSVVFGEDACVP